MDSWSKQLSFYDGWIYVEFFLILTGYFTRRHFDSKENKKTVKASIVYTINKFLPLIPYTVVAILLMWSLDGIVEIIEGKQTIIGFLISFFKDYIFSVLLVVESYRHSLVNHLWYLSAMFIIFPLFSTIVQLKDRYILMTISILYSLVYYGAVGITGATEFPIGILRVLAGLFLGVFVYESTYVFEYYITQANRNIVLGLELFTFAFPIVSSFYNLELYRFSILCFMANIAIMCSGVSCFKNLKGKLIINYLGKLSVPIYINHLVIGKSIYYLGLKLQWTEKIEVVLYFLITLIVSAVAMFFVEHWKWFQQIIRAPIILKE